MSALEDALKQKKEEKEEEGKEEVDPCDTMNIFLRHSDDLSTNLQPEV